MNAPAQIKSLMRSSDIAGRLPGHVIHLAAALILAVGGMAFAGNVPKLNADNFIKPQAIKHFGPFDWTSNLETATHPCEKTTLEDRASFRVPNTGDARCSTFFNTEVRR